MQLVNGVALVARLAKSAEDLGVLLWESAPVTELLRDEAGVCGALVNSAKGPIRIHARKAVVLAAGGFANDVERRKALFPRTPTGHEHWALPPLAVNGDGLRLGESVGATVNTDWRRPWPGRRSRKCRMPTAASAISHTSSNAANRESSAYCATAGASSTKPTVTTTTSAPWLPPPLKAKKSPRG